MNYQKIYDAIIEKAKSENRIKVRKISSIMFIMKIIT
jgi:hypothetical protein